MYRCLYHRSSGPVHPAAERTQVITPFNGPAYGVQGALFAPLIDPLPLAFPVVAARISRTTDANAKAQGQGLKPLHPARRARPPLRRRTAGL